MSLLTFLRSKVVDLEFIKFLDTIHKGSKSLELEWSYPEIIVKFRFHPEASERRLRILLPNETDILIFQWRLDECFGGGEDTCFTRKAFFTWTQGKIETSRSVYFLEPGIKSVLYSGEEFGEIRYVGGEE